jgi:hypothetical protein
MQRCILNGNAEYEDGNLQRAYTLYFRAAVIYLEIMPKHAGYNDPKFSAVKVRTHNSPQLCRTITHGSCVMNNERWWVIAQLATPSGTGQHQSHHYDRKL